MKKIKITHKKPKMLHVILFLAIFLGFMTLPSTQVDFNK